MFLQKKENSAVLATLLSDVSSKEGKLRGACDTADSKLHVACDTAESKLRGACDTAESCSDTAPEPFIFNTALAQEPALAPT